jgi:diguanylate cyclase (GGDEF)-like protein
VRRGLAARSTGALTATPFPDNSRTNFIATLPRESILESLRPVWPVAGILAVAVLIGWTGASLPPSLAGLRTAGPCALLAVAAGVSVWFNRGRPFVLAVSLLAAYGAFHYRPGALVYVAIATGVPLNALIALSLHERGARFGRAWRWLALLAVEVFLVYLIGQKLGYRESLDGLLLRAPPTPLLARLVFAAAFALAARRAWPHHMPTEVAMAGALASFFIACEWMPSERVYSLFNTAAGAILLVAVLHESHRMAFRDALTGLPNRRALEDHLRALKPPYALAMVDVDHFKKFNDVHGHDIGDQVLRLVAARLAEVQGGGRAYRYGGEEFTVVFRGQRLAEVLPHLEHSRESVQNYKMTVRGEDRPKDRKQGSKRRSARRNARPAEDFERTDMLLSVTVSMGAAEPGKHLKTPAEVLKGADEALYRAKERGRNRVSR